MDEVAAIVVQSSDTAPIDGAINLPPRRSPLLNKLSTVGSPARGVVRLFAVLGFMVTLAASAPSFAQDTRSAPVSFADLAEKLSPAVVNIATTQTLQQQSGDGLQMPEFPPG